MSRSPIELAALATLALPGIDVVATQPPQHQTPTLQSTAILDSTGRSWVLTAPLNPLGATELATESAFLDSLGALRETLPFALPKPAGYAPLPEGGQAVAWRTLPGRTLQPDTLTPGPGLAAAIGSTIASLHNINPQLVEAADIPTYTDETYRQRLLNEVDEMAKTGEIPGSLLNRWELALEEQWLWKFAPVLTHGDLTEDSIHVERHEVVALTSLGNVKIADPAIDFAWLSETVPLDAYASLTESYVYNRPGYTDQGLEHRVLLTSELNVGRWLLHGWRNENPQILSDARQMLNELATDISNAPPIGTN